MLIGGMVGYLSANLAAMARYQTMASTGKLIQKASEDPVVASRSLKLNTDISVLNQYKKNADSALAWMEATETAIRSLDQQLIEIRTRIVQASNTGPMADEDRQSIASHVKQLREEVISLANSTYSGRYIFSGYKSDTPLLDKNGFFNAAVTSLEKIYYEVGVTNKIQVNVTGDSLFNLGDPAGSLPARSALVQDIDDMLALLDAKAAVVSSAPLNLSGPGVFDMKGVGVSLTLGSGPAKTILFDEANVKHVNRMTGAQIIDFLNKKIGLDGTASLDKDGNIVIKSLAGPGAAVADAVGAAAGSAASLFGESYAAAGAVLTGSRSLTQPTVDISGYNVFSIIVNRSSDPIQIDLSAAAPPAVRDLKYARPDEIAAEINRQIASAISAAAPTANMIWVKCTFEDGRFCLTSESFGVKSYIEIAGGDEIYDLFGVMPEHKQGNVEQQGRLVGSRDFREPVADVTQFRGAPTPPETIGPPPSVRVLINGVFIANIVLDDGDPSIDPRNMTLRQIMKKIDDQLGMHGTCDIDEGRLVLRSAVGGPNSSIEIAGMDDDFYEFLFGADPVIINGANEPTHGFYKSGIAFGPADAIDLPAGFTMKALIDGATGSPYELIVGNFPAGAGIVEIADHINKAYMSDPVLAQIISPAEFSNYSFASIVDGKGDQLYPPIGGAVFTGGAANMFLVLKSHTWGTGSGVKIESAAKPPDAAYAEGMAALFGKGTINAPSVMGGADGFEEEICKWLDTADAHLANLNKIWTDLGARMNRGEMTQDRLEIDKIVSETLLAENESVDEAKAIMLLQIAELVYNASLAVGARVIQPSLIDFLR
jgi:flagellar hook-associated protein 3 FlgL